jgi:hypothetical protein
MREYIAISSALLLAACYHGPSIATFEPVQGPYGIDADLRLQKTRVRGELLEVQDTALIVLTVLTDSDRVVSVPVRAIRTGVFDKLGLVIDEGVPRESALAKVRPFSRFPTGLTPALRARLLAAYGQTAVLVVQ